MDSEEKLALFLGMLSGDGCLSIKHNGEGYRNYPIDFCNNDKRLVLLFDELFYDLFGIRGKISSRHRPGRKLIWHFLKHSVKIAKYLISLGFPEGVKRDSLRLMPFIRGGDAKIKLAFINGIILTDGHIRISGRLHFHLGSKSFIEDLAAMFYELTGIKRQVKEFRQGAYKSYQLSLNKREGTFILSQMPTWDNGTPTVLS